MANKKHSTGHRAKKTKKHAPAESSPPSTPVPPPNPALDPPKLDATLDPSDVRVKGPQAAEAAAELEFELEEGRAAGQAGSLQGISDLPDADPESVEELLEEGNAFEAGIVKGVEDVPDADQGEIKTHEVPEDDVPEEYRDVET